jgi:8-oxo-dGTP pyrophosphatase MutT (NUDIX family)
VSAGREHVEAAGRAQQQVMAILDRTQERIDAVIREAEEEIGRIRRETRERTGIDIGQDSSPQEPAITDVRCGDLALLASNCRHVVAAVDLLGAEHVRAGSTRLLGSVLKAGVDLETAAAAVRHLQRSGFFGSSGVE